MDRWEQLLMHLESEFAFQDMMSRSAVATELSRAEMSRIDARQRLKATAGQTVEIHLASGSTLSGQVVNCHQEWLLLTIGAQGIIVPHDAMVGVSGLSAKALAEPDKGSEDAGAPARMILSAREVTLNSALRAVSRGRGIVRVHAKGHEYRGRIQRVGKDHVDVLSGGVGEWEERRNTLSSTVLLSGVDYVVLE